MGRKASARQRREKALAVQQQQQQQPPPLPEKDSSASESASGEEAEGPGPGAGRLEMLASSVGGGFVSESEASGGRHNGNRKKVFQARESVLTQLTSTDPNMEALYHMFMVIIISAIAYSMLQDSVDAGKPYIDFAYYISGFGPVEQQLVAVLLWVPLQLAAFAVYPTFNLWVWLHKRLGLPVDVFFIFLVILYNFVAHSLVVFSIVTFDLSPVPSLTLSVEQLRFSMKSYSFIRENAYKVLYPWHKDDTSGPAVWYEGQIEPTVGRFSQYLYFLFAPTLIYRDRYPRTPRVRKSRVLSHFLKTAISVAFMTILVKEIFQAPPNTPKLLMHTLLSCMLWGLVFQFMMGYFFLHSWSNLFGELLRFADREFYSNWWTCTSFASWYRKWNLLVHDWIKAYIYQDSKALFNNKYYNPVASLLTIFISAMFHEYVIWAPTRFFVPVLLSMFGSFGAILYFVRADPRSRFWNYFLHTSLSLGLGILIFFYSIELSSRRICVKEENFVNTFIPRFYECFLS